MPRDGFKYLATTKRKPYNTLKTNRPHFCIAASIAGVSIPEVLSGLGDSLAVEADDDAAQFLITVGNIEVDLSHSINIHYSRLARLSRTLCVIFGPLVASLA